MLMQSNRKRIINSYEYAKELYEIGRRITYQPFGFNKEAITKEEYIQLISLVALENERMVVMDSRDIAYVLMYQTKKSISNFIDEVAETMMKRYGDTANRVFEDEVNFRVFTSNEGIINDE